MWRVSASLLLFLCVAQSTASVSPCVSACLSAQPSDGAVVFCGTDGVTYNASRAQVITRDCFAYCGVSVLYVGTIACIDDDDSEGCFLFVCLDVFLFLICVGIGRTVWVSEQLWRRGERSVCGGAMSVL